MDFVHVLLAVFIIVIKFMMIAHFLRHHPRPSRDDYQLPNGNHKPKELRMDTLPKWVEQFHNASPENLRKVILKELLNEDATIIDVTEDSIEWRDNVDNHWKITWGPA